MWFVANLIPLRPHEPRHQYTSQPRTLSCDWFSHGYSVIGLVDVQLSSRISTLEPSYLGPIQPRTKLQTFRFLCISFMRDTQKSELHRKRNICYNKYAVPINYACNPIAVHGGRGTPSPLKEEEEVTLLRTLWGWYCILGMNLGSAAVVSTVTDAD